MSLTAILKKIEKVDQKHKEIIMRYNSASRECPRQHELEREEQEDQRIFGYSGSQILGLFKQGKKDLLQKTRPCTAVPVSEFTPSIGKRQIRKSANEKRAYSISKPAVRYKEQYNFLFKEDIFDDKKDRVATPWEGVKGKKRDQRLVSNLKRQGVPLSVKQQHKRSMQQQRQRFIEDFEENLQLLKNRQQFTRTMAIRNKMTYERKGAVNRSKATNKENQEDLFKLTKTTFQLGPKTIKVTFVQSEQHLRELNSFLNHYEDSRFLAIDSLNRDPLPFDRFQEELLNYLPQTFTVTCISLTSLQSVKLQLQISNDQMIVTSTKERVSLKSLRDSVLAEEESVHMCFHTKDTLLYELYLLNKNLTFNKNIEYQITLLSYQLKRFLLFDDRILIKAACQSAELMLKSNVDIPDQFFQFVGTFSKKMVHFFDKDRRYFTLCLKSVLMRGLKGVQAFKREVGFGQKVIKLKEGTRQEFKKQLYNWAYFYICSSVSAKISIFVIVVHFFPLDLLHTLKSPLVLLHLLPPKFPHQLPGDLGRFTFSMLLFFVRL